MEFWQRQQIALECFGGLENFEKKSREKIHNLLKEKVKERGERHLIDLSRITGVPYNILFLLVNKPEEVPITSYLIEYLACPLDISACDFFLPPTINAEEKMFFEKCAKEEGFCVIGCCEGKELSFDPMIMYVYLIALDRINALAYYRQNAFIPSTSNG